MYKIVDQQVFSPVTFLWEVEAPDVAAAAQPGHFIMLRLNEGGERIPLTVADFDRERGTITLVIQALGKTTKEIAAALGVSTKTIETHRRNIMQKLDLHSVAELTKYAIREGVTSIDH